MAAQFAAGMNQGLQPIRCDMCSIRTLPCAYCDDSLVRMVPPDYAGQGSSAAAGAEEPSVGGRPGPDDDRRRRDRSQGPSGSRGVCSNNR